MSAGGVEPRVVYVRVVAEEPDTLGRLLDNWGDEGPHGELATSHKTFTIGQTPVLVRLLVSFQWGPPSYSKSGRWDPSPFLSGADVVLLVHREDTPKSFKFLTAFCKAVARHRSSVVFRVVPVAVLGLHDVDPDTEGPTKMLRLAKAIGAVGFFRQSKMGSPLGLDAVLEDLLGYVLEPQHMPLPKMEAAIPDARFAGWRPRLLWRLFWRWMDF
ncbi:uncharacterized protein DNG_04537 [Cephalotrichum gorgonifer]|uniref:Uncharacterized protein n=1 Tax=Cephalotrichum gorgonifer TaxID=2041049 RepID=A0AAE8MY63_9PEZI|nr:uncharacterized protein DNG_04537 [Cephalotrichum gorgonifer]